MGNIVLSSSDWKRILDTLDSSFALRTMDNLVLQHLPDIHGDVTWADRKNDAFFELTKVANAFGVLDQLLLAAAAERPFRPDLRALVLFFSRRPGWFASVAVNELDVRGALEALSSSDPFIDAAALARWSIAVEHQVGVVRCGLGHGTGFLVGPDLVLTCYHVVESHLKGTTPIDDVKVRFDYLRAADGSLPPFDDGWIALDPSWSIPASPYGQADLSLQGEPSDDELDFAVLKLSTPVGRSAPSGGDRPRGWIDVSHDVPLPATESPIFIAQHPRRTGGGTPLQTLQMACATPGFDRSTGPRLVYKTSTLKGSSGSPVFDQKLRAIGLHHNQGEIRSGQPDLVDNNRGIPLARIRAALTDEVRASLTGPP